MTSAGVAPGAITPASVSQPLAQIQIIPPKKPTSAYNLWMAQERVSLRSRNLQLSFSEFAKRWRDLPERDKKPFVDASNLEKSRYDLEIKRFKASSNYAVYLQQQSKAKAAASMSERKKNEKRKIFSGYILFCKEHRKKLQDANPNADFSELSRLVANSWNEISEPEREELNERAKKIFAERMSKAKADKK